MKSRSIVVAILALAWLAALPGASQARNPNCSGGILYLDQAMKHKALPGGAGMEDYHREIAKAVQRLEMCAEEDPNDFEALGTLAWAYAEVESAGPAGRSFERAIQGLTAKGDKKKIAWAKNNRESYWATEFNEGIANINSAQSMYPDYSKEPADDGERVVRVEAGKLYEKALVHLTRASLLKSGDPRTMRNLGTTHAFMGDYAAAEAKLKEGLAAVPNDSDMVATLRSVQNSAALKLVSQQKFDEALVYYDRLVVENPGDGGLWMGLADAHFKRAQTVEGEARKAAFQSAGTAFAKAGTLRAEDADLPFNAALAFQNAGAYEKAAGQWRATLKLRPEDPDAESALGSTLAELKQFDEAVTHVHRAVILDPKNKLRHRQLGAVYTKAGNNAKATEELMVFLALQNGKAVGDVSAEVAKARAGSDASRMMADAGAPEDIYLWQADDESYESWFYWSKHIAQHFKAGAKVQRSDWTPAGVKAAK